MLKRFILNTKDMKRDVFIWNALSAMLNSFQTTILLIFVTRFGDDKESSMFVMAYAVANLLLHIGKFGMRQFQVTDTKEKYTYKEYEILRRILVTAMMVISIAYVAIKTLQGVYVYEKSILILLICVMRAIEAYEDVIHGRLQQVGRLDIGTKILSLRLAFYMLTFAVLYIVLRDVVTVSIITVLIQLILAVILNKWAIEETQNNHLWNKKKVKALFLEVFPLGVAMFINIYINNSPKYIIDELVSDAVQTRFNIVFMPVFVVAMLAGFVYQPLVKKMGYLWSVREVKQLNAQVTKICVITIVIALLATGAAYIAGTPVLGIVYGLDLSGFRNELALLTFTGGIIALLNIFILLITTVRKQQFLLYGYIVVAIVMLLMGTSILKKFDIIGLCIFFMMVLLLLLLYFIVVYLVETRKG